MSVSSSVPQWIQSVLALPGRQAQIDTLRQQGYLSRTGLEEMLDVATMLASRSPDQAGALAALVADIAVLIDESMDLRANAHYLQARSASAAGAFETALTLIRQSQETYQSLGRAQDMLHTRIGEINVLHELGRFQEALTVADETLTALQVEDLIARPQADPEKALAVANLHLNRGACLIRLGYHTEALSAFAIAESILQALEETEQQTLVLNNRGVLLVQMGRIQDALRLYQQAAQVQEQAGLHVLLAHTQINIGEAYLLAGDYARSLAAFERANDLLTERESSVDRQIALRQMADAYLSLNLFEEAQTSYHNVAEALGSVGMIHEQAWALWGEGAALAGQDLLSAARQALEQATLLFQQVDDPLLLCDVLIERSGVEEQMGQTQVALANARQALALAQERNFPVQQALASLRLADLERDDPAASESHLVAAETALTGLDVPHLRYRLAARLGRVRRAEGQLDLARAHLESAIEQIEALRSTLPQEALRASFLQDKLAAYEELIQLHLESDAPDWPSQAFTVVERARSRALADLLRGGVVARRQAASGDTELQEQLDAVQSDLNALYNDLFRGSSSAGMGERRSVLALQTRIHELEQRLQQLKLQGWIEADDPFARPLPPATIQARLEDDLVLVNYVLLNDEITVFLLGREHLEVIRRVSTVATTRKLLEQLETQWQFLQMGQAFAERHMTRLEQNTRPILAQLYSELFALIQSILDSSFSKVRRLVILPQGLLHGVPFQALFDGEHYLLERWEISYAPSATVYSICEERSLCRDGVPLVMGVADPSIPAVVAETAIVASHFDDAELYLNEEARAETLISQAPGSRLVHLACHGYFRADNPMFSALKFSDRWFTAADAAELNLENALVTLSACESGRSRVLNGNEPIGLARGFLGSGAATLVVSQWLVQDEAGAILMAEWYERLSKGTTPVAALRAAQLALMESHPHPYYWAPFILMGNRTIRFVSTLAQQPDQADILTNGE